MRLATFKLNWSVVLPVSREVTALKLTAFNVQLGLYSVCRQEDWIRFGGVGRFISHNMSPTSKMTFVAPVSLMLPICPTNATSTPTIAGGKGVCPMGQYAVVTLTSAPSKSPAFNVAMSDVLVPG